MCGIFGILNSRNALDRRAFRATADDLFQLSESRGKEAAGLAILTPSEIRVYKRAVSAHRLIRSPGYRRFFDSAMPVNGERREARPLALIGHSRLVTNGAQELHDNNQPVIRGGQVAIHNGIIVNDEALWHRFPSMERRYQVDTEVLLGLIRKLRDEGSSLADAIRGGFAKIEGTAAVAVMFEDVNRLALATNYGSLYRITSLDGGLHIFASELYILKRLREKAYVRTLLKGTEVRRIPAGEGLFFDTESMAIEAFPLSGDIADGSPAPDRANRVIVDMKRSAPDLRAAPGSRPIAGGPPPSMRVPSRFDRHFRRSRAAISRLRRCTKCLLPETMPWVAFDAQGVCFYCRNYRKIKCRGRRALEATLAPFRSSNGEPDCIVAFSGGRDSSYGVHVLKTELGMTPVAYTYDWGMITDLGRRNQARMCGKHGIEHILVSADIRRKRANIRQNVTAWLKRPHLGSVPLFMAGDKQYFYFANKLRRQVGIRLIVLCVNMLEATSFKSGFAGVAPVLDGEHAYTLTPAAKLRLAAFYTLQYLKNPRYINASLIDTVHAFFSYYMISHDYLNLYNYIPWDEDTIAQTLIEECDWEMAGDTDTTWRIGDGTASFYNYIYYVVAGFTENDTFRSNQIREGMICRREGLEIVERESVPRYESLKWYCDTIGIDFEDAIDRINRIPPLYAT